MKNMTFSRPAEFWQALFSPDSVAVIGAKNLPGSWGFDIFKTLLADVKAGVKRLVYAVNPNVPQILGETTYNTILDIPGPVDLAVIVVPPDIVPAVMQQCVQKKVQAVVIVTAGFAETGQEGSQRQAEVTGIARQGGISFVGPNCLGHADKYSRLDITVLAGRITAGPLAILSQSGTVGINLILSAASSGIGMSKFVSTGNEADLHMEDYLEFLAHDPDTRIIAAYIEGLREGRRFFQLTKEITHQKPVIVMKVGSTTEAGRAARSHTSALAGADHIYSAAFRQSGVIRVEDEDELCDVAAALIDQPLPNGDRIGILTVGGGLGVITVEACEKEGLRIASLEAGTMQKMDALLPQRWSHGNPVDLAGSRHMGEDSTVLSCISLLMDDKNVDAVIALIPPVLPSSSLNGIPTPEQRQQIQTEYQKFLSFLNQQVKRTNKPLYLIKKRLSIIHPEANPSLSTAKEKVPEYFSPRRAARVLYQLNWYRQYLESQKD
jgi:acyl-CoA synthetase (NDP forming)